MRGVDTRVILVGRTGLDAALRLDGGLELVRVRTPVDAIGELANPMDPDPASTRAVVVVSREVEDSLRTIDQGRQAEADRLMSFVRGLKLAEPNVRVLGVTRPESAGPTVVGEFDGLVSPGWDPSSLAKYIRAAESRTAEGPVASGGIECKPEQSPLSGLAAAVEPGDCALVSLLLHGQDILESALSLMRVRTGDLGVTLAPVSGEPPPGSAPVTWEGALFGHLIGTLDAPKLAEQARWLAGWLRLRDQQTQLRTAAFTDPLTGAWNRRYFERYLNAAMEQARQRRQTVAVLLFDIDDFKKYNDQYGHEAGDEILMETVKLMRSVIRPSDRVCRIGGDEFAVVFHDPEGPRQEGSRGNVSVMDVARRFQAQIKQHRFPKLGDCAPGTLSISGGMATFPWDGASAAELLNKADQLALVAKRQGKNAIRFGPEHPGDGGSSV